MKIILFHDYFPFFGSFNIYSKSNCTFKSLRNCKRRKKGNFTSKSNSIKTMLCGILSNIILF